MAQFKLARKVVKQVVTKAMDAAFEHKYKALDDKGGDKPLLFAFYFLLFFFLPLAGPTGIGFWPSLR